MQRYKKFEQILSDSFKTIDDADVRRLPDQMSGYYGSKNDCDLMVYHWPTLFYFEAKSFAGDSFCFNYKEGTSFHNQLNGLYERCKISGVVGGFIFWAVDYKKVFFVHVNIIKSLIDTGYKSITVKNLIESSSKRNKYVVNIESEVTILYPKLVNPLKFLREIK